MWKNGTVSCADFNAELEDFLKRSKALGDDWEVRVAPEYLQVLLELVVCVKASNFFE